MKIKSKTSLSKKSIIAATVLIVLVGIGLYTTHHFQLWPFTPHIPKQSAAVQAASKPASNNTAAKTNALKTTENPNVDTSKTTSQIPTSPTTTLAITQLVEQNGSVTYAAQITNPGQSGSCSAVFTSKIDRPVTHTENANGSTCGPTSIPANSFTSFGQWTLTLRYYTNNTQATATQAIDIK